MELNFKFNIINESDEHEGELADLYKGIYIVLINRLIHIAFIPSINKADRSWPPQLPDDIDSITTIDEAKNCTLLFNEFVVSNSNEHAGKVETFSINVGNPKLKKTTLFYITEEEFEMAMKEMKEFKEELYGIHSFKASSEVKTTYLYQCINSIIPYFDSNQKEILEKNANWK